MTKSRAMTISRLSAIGISYDDAVSLCRAERVIHTWGEHECNGAIQRDEQTNVPYWHSTQDGRRLYRTADRETGALKRAEAIAKRYGLTLYHQPDPRGCQLYLLRAGDVPEGKDVDSYYSRGVAVCG